MQHNFKACKGKKKNGNKPRAPAIAISSSMPSFSLLSFHHHNLTTRFYSEEPAATNLKNKK